MLDVTYRSGIMEPSWTAKQWIASFEPFRMGESLLSTRSDLPENDQSMNKHELASSTAIPVATTSFSLNSSECVMGTIKVPVTQLSLVHQRNLSSSQLVANCQKT